MQVAGEVSSSDDRRHERERASGDSAATRFFARMRRIEDAPRGRRAGPAVVAAPANARPAARAATHCDRPCQPDHSVIHYTAMIDVETGRFTVGVFQDVAWAQKGLDALKQAGFAAESLTILAKESPEVAALIERVFGAPGSGSTCRHRRGRRSRPAARGPAGAGRGISRSWVWRARCGASGFRRTTAGFSRR